MGVLCFTVFRPLPQGYNIYPINKPSNPPNAPTPRAQSCFCAFNYMLIYMILILDLQMYSTYTCCRKAGKSREGGLCVPRATKKSKQQKKKTGRTLNLVFWGGFLGLFWGMFHFLAAVSSKNRAPIAPRHIFPASFVGT